MNREREDQLHRVIEQVVEELAICVRQVSVEELVQAGALIEAAPRIFVAGAGRSGLCMRSFAMRLMHLGKTIYIVGETTTPSIVTGDLLILGSGSGRTASLVAMTDQARRQGAKILIFTATISSPLANLADHHVIIPAPMPKSSSEGVGPSSIQPMRTLFEQALLIVSDALVLGLMQQMGIDAAQMSERHANLE